ncbi:hypothetical protein EOL70_17005 [Leucothrix sargassi]|nr:hypothetical protein EOL70_17005 [Leucothrix sargassi]
MSAKYFRSATIGVMVLSCDLVWANDITYTGATGTLFLPNAYTLQQGRFAYQYNNFGEEFYKNQYSSTFNNVMTIGITPFLEIGGRLTEYYNDDQAQDNGITAGRRDLSANVKLKLPKLGYGLPEFALGANDIAGEAVHFRSQYVVGTKALGKGTYSVGYGTGDNPELDGAFASAKYDFTPHFSVMGEYAADKYSLGARYDFSRFLKLPVAITASMPFGSEDSDNDELVLGLSVSSPITADARNKKAAKAVTLSFANQQDDYNSLVAALRSYGLESVSVGHVGDELVIAYENKVYNHNYLDGMALVVGSALEYVRHDKVINVVLLDNKIAKLAARFPLASLKEYFVKNDGRSQRAFAGQVKVWYPAQSYLSPQRVKWLKGVAARNKTWFDVTLQPKVRTVIGHEWSEGEYSLAARADLDVPLWKGASLHVAGSEPVSNSTLFDDGRVFAQSRQRAGLNEALIQQTVKPSSTSAVMTSAGLMEVQNEMYYTVQSEASLRSRSGSTGLYAKAAAYEPKDDEGLESVNTGLISVKQDLSQYDAQMELAYGRFFEGDNGVRLDLTRQFGPADVASYVKYLDQDNIEAGLQLTLPLTPRKDFKRGGLVVRGNEHWSYSQGSTIKDPLVSGGNPIRLNKLQNPMTHKNLNDDFYENDRLTPAYFKANVDRLREAYVNLRRAR